MADGGSRWLAPRVVIPLAIVLLVFAALLAPADQNEQATLTTHSAGLFGARGIHDVLARLGWPVSRLEHAFAPALDSAAVFAVLEPPMELSATEAARLLDAVRRGAGLLLIPRAGSSLADSIGIAAYTIPFARHVRVERTAAGVPPSADTARSSGMPSFNQVLLGVRRSRTDSTRRPMPPDTMSFATVLRDSMPSPGVLGLPYGRGRIVLVADGRMLQNRYVREGAPAVLAVRLVEWMGRGRRAPVVFDEWHQGYGQRPSITGTIRRGLVHTPAGRVTLQVAVAGLLLLLALGPRPIPPRPRERIERRSPLEHVGALARAYEQVGATRLATRELVRGVRRRHPFGSGGGGAADDDAAYLASLSARRPELVPDVALLLDAADRQVEPAELVRIGQAIDHIERVLSQ